jgi:hypothetical protein
LPWDAGKTFFSRHALSGMSEDAAIYRQRADECREQAAKAIGPLDREAWLRLAEEWLKLAKSAERRDQG